MGRRGPAPTPTAIKKLRGETRPSRLHVLEPLPSSTLPDPPELSPAAAIVWRRTVDAAPPGLLTAADFDVVRAYVEAVVRHEQAIGLFRAMGPIVESKRADGPAYVRSPMAQVVRDAAEQVRLLARELGFSPAARVGLRLDPAAEELAAWDDVGLPPRLALARGR